MISLASLTVSLEFLSPLTTPAFTKTVWSPAVPLKRPWRLPNHWIRLLDCTNINVLSEENLKEVLKPRWWSRPPASWMCVSEAAQTLLVHEPKWLPKPKLRTSPKPIWSFSTDLALAMGGRRTSCKFDGRQSQPFWIVTPEMISQWMPTMAKVGGWAYPRRCPNLGLRFFFTKMGKCLSGFC